MFWAMLSAEVDRVDEEIWDSPAPPRAPRRKYTSSEQNLRLFILIIAVSVLILVSCYAAVVLRERETRARGGLAACGTCCTARA